MSTEEIKNIAAQTEQLRAQLEGDLKVLSKSSSGIQQEIGALSASSLKRANELLESLITNPDIDAANQSLSKLKLEIVTSRKQIYHRAISSAIGEMKSALKYTFMVPDKANLELELSELEENLNTALSNRDIDASVVSLKDIFEKLDKLRNKIDRQKKGILVKAFGKTFIWILPILLGAFLSGKFSLAWLSIFLVVWLVFSYLISFTLKKFEHITKFMKSPKFKNIYESLFGLAFIGIFPFIIIYAIFFSKESKIDFTTPNRTSHISIGEQVSVLYEINNKNKSILRDITIRVDVPNLTSDTVIQRNYSSIAGNSVYQDSISFLIPSGAKLGTYYGEASCSFYIDGERKRKTENLQIFVIR